jgi:hypothetical protein
MSNVERVVAGGADPGTCDSESGTAGVNAPGYSKPRYFVSSSFSAGGSRPHKSASCFR